MPNDTSDMIYQYAATLNDEAMINEQELISLWNLIATSMANIHTPRRTKTLVPTCPKLWDNAKTLVMHHADTRVIPSCRRKVC
jgi:hypothetical protein